jgi:hypothetical protein
MKVEFRFSQHGTDRTKTQLLETQRDICRYRYMKISLGPTFFSTELDYMMYSAKSKKQTDYVSGY